jgi:hypothetical protein
MWGVHAKDPPVVKALFSTEGFMLLIVVSAPALYTSAADAKLTEIVAMAI